MDFSPQDLEDRLVKYDVEAAKFGPEWAAKQGLSDSTEDRKNDYLAYLTDKAEGSTNAEKERKARTSKEWEDFRIDLARMKQEALDAKIRYQIAMRHWDTARSLLASKNAERRTGT